MRKPNFFIVGSPKCGTTTIANWLANHPQVYFSQPKEPFFFCSELRMGVTSIHTYEQLFDNADAQHIAIGEGTTHYIYSETAVPRILEYNPEAKFIVCIRNPIEMAPSLHAERLFSGFENVKEFSLAWAMQADRMAGRRVPWAARDDKDLLQYGPICMHGALLARLLKTVSRECVLVVLLDDMIESPGVVGEDLTKFLGICSVDTPLIAANPRKDIRSSFLASLIRYPVRIKKAIGVDAKWGLANSLRALNAREGKKGTIDVQTREMLKEYFREDIKVLEEILSRDFAAWLT